MLDLSVIILTYNEGLHIRRAIENVKSLTEEIYVIDSLSTDNTQRIARTLGAHVIEHEWPGNQAEQFNWALKNIDIKSEWILRIDADEYLLPELIQELKAVLPNLPSSINGIVLKRRHIFMNRWMKGGIYPVKLLRIFRRGYGIYESRLMDEHIILKEGDIYECKNDFCDHNLNNLSWFCKKHIDYAVREAAEMLDNKYNISNRNQTVTLVGQSASKRKKKDSYAKKPLFWRAGAYFLYRYLLKGAWKDGKEGFIFSFLQGWWYRSLVDANIYEIEKEAGYNPQKIKSILTETYSISL